MSLGGCLAGKTVQGFPDKSTPTLPYNPETRITKPVKTALAAITFSLSLLAGVSRALAATVTLYDGTLNSPPSNQGWIFFAPGATQTVGGGATTLNTTANDSIRGGYTRSDNTLDRQTGYTLRFDLQLLQENHSNPNAQNNPGTDNIADRAGLSLIVLSSDRRGIELGFWTNDANTTNRIWAQNDGAVKADPVSAPTGTRFTHAEGTSFNPGTAVNRYDLSILGNTYNLYANSNFNSPILSGSLRDYQNEGAPYTTSNFIFLGDNTTSARGSFSLARADVTDAPIATAAAVPFDFNPTFGLLILGAWTAFSHLRTKQK